MSPILDPAILKALSLDVALTSITSHGGSGFSSTAKITTKVDGEEKLYFVKTGSGKDAEIMFAGEYLFYRVKYHIFMSLKGTQNISVDLVSFLPSQLSKYLPHEITCPYTPSNPPSRRTYLPQRPPLHPALPLPPKPRPRRSFLRKRLLPRDGLPESPQPEFRVGPKKFWIGTLPRRQARQTACYACAHPRRLRYAAVRLPRADVLRLDSAAE